MTTVNLLPTFLRWRLQRIRDIFQVTRRMRKWDVVDSLAMLDIVEEQYGHDRSRRSKRPVDADGNSLPWYTYPAIDYIRELDFSEWDVFEYGTGYGTLFWRTMARDVVTVEHDEVWYGEIRDQLTGAGTLLLRKEKEGYIKTIGELGKLFHVIIIDGVHRRACATQVGVYLAKGGLVILDNSDWYPNTSAFLRGMGLLQVDFTGFGPVNDYTWTTSFFFSPTACLRPRHGRQPMPGIGSLRSHAADDEMP